MNAPPQIQSIGAWLVRVRQGAVAVLEPDKRSEGRLVVKTILSADMASGGVDGDD